MLGMVVSEREKEDMNSYAHTHDNCVHVDHVVHECV